MRDSTGKEWSLGFDSFNRRNYCYLDELNESNTATNEGTITFNNKGVTLNTINTNAVMNNFSELNKKIEKLEDAFKETGFVIDKIRERADLNSTYTASKWHFRASDIVLRLI